MAGQILDSAFSEDQANWDELSALVVDHFHLADKLLSGKDLVER